MGILGKRKGDFSEQMNMAISIISEQKYSCRDIMLRFLLMVEFDNCAFPEIVSELKRLDLVNVTKIELEEAYSLKRHIKQASDSLPREFYGNPYGYFLDEERKNRESEVMKKWYDTENAKKQFEDFPQTESRAKWGLRISVATLIVTIVLEIIKWQCNNTS